jgi:hypothetical protein
MDKMFSDDMERHIRFAFGTLSLGFLLLLIGALIAHLIKDEKKKNRAKWVWIGAAASLVIWLLIGL